MAFTQQQLDAIHAAIASGVLTVTFGGRSTTYQNMSDMLEAASIMQRALSTDTRAYRLSAHSKGV